MRLHNKLFFFANQLCTFPISGGGFVDVTPVLANSCGLLTTWGERTLCRSSGESGARVLNFDTTEAL